MIKGRSGYLNIFTFSYSKHNFFLLIPREGVLELADLRWNSSVKKSMPRENPGEWKEIQAPKYDRYPGRIQGSEGVGDSK